MILFLSPYVLKSETYGNETKAAVFPMMLLCMYQVMYYPVYQGVDGGRVPGTRYLLVRYLHRAVFVKVTWSFSYSIAHYMLE
jgi:hypothetical protein